VLYLKRKRQLAIIKVLLDLATEYIEKKGFREG
jgi:hypothetical protein